MTQTLNYFFCRKFSKQIEKYAEIGYIETMKKNQNPTKSFKDKHPPRILEKSKKPTQIFKPIRRFWDLSARLEHRRIKSKKK